MRVVWGGRKRKKKCGCIRRDEQNKATVVPVSTVLLYQSDGKYELDMKNM